MSNHKWKRVTHVSEKITSYSKLLQLLLLDFGIRWELISLGFPIPPTRKEIYHDVLLLHKMGGSCTTQGQVSHHRQGYRVRWSGEWKSCVDDACRSANLYLNRFTQNPMDWMRVEIKCSRQLYARWWTLWSKMTGTSTSIPSCQPTKQQDMIQRKCRPTSWCITRIPDYLCRWFQHLHI